MTIPVIQESDTYLAGWGVRKGQRFISTWLTIFEQEQKWFDREMILRFGKNWREEDE